MKTLYPLHGLIAATHTPFHSDGSLNLGAIEKQAMHLVRKGIDAVFIGGTTGEFSSLTLEERLALTQRWSEVIPGTPLKLIVHVGSNCLADARVLAAQAESLNATAIAALAPSYFKPASVEALIACCAEVASAAPAIPFYYYDIPALTGVCLSMPEFLEQTRASGRVPTLAGLKFTNPDLLSYQHCLRANEGAWDLPFGLDEHLLGALALGAKGAVGSGFNFAGPIYRRLLRSFAAGDLTSARMEQFRGAQIVRLLASQGYMASAKTVMEMLGVPVGPPRLPHLDLPPKNKDQLKRALDEIGFFEWVK